MADPVIRADVTYPRMSWQPACPWPFSEYEDGAFEGFYQKKLPISIVLNSEMITTANAQDYYNPDAPF